jgi:uncharacterized protein YjaG (DUF416 family)
MKMNVRLSTLLNNLEKQIKFAFIPSSPERKLGGYLRHTKDAVAEVDRVHDNIEKALYSYLLMQGFNKSQIACDTTSFGGKIADVVVRSGDNNFDIYEIKTDTDVRRGLREAIGQLLDYATWEKGITVKNIYAVLPYFPISENIKYFIQRVKKNIRFKFKVLFYNKTTKIFLSPA